MSYGAYSPYSSYSGGLDDLLKKKIGWGGGVLFGITVVLIIYMALSGNGWSYMFIVGIFMAIGLVLKAVGGSDKVLTVLGIESFPKAAA
jgi:hypothetical protein